MKHRILGVNDLEHVSNDDWAAVLLELTDLVHRPDTTQHLLFSMANTVVRVYSFVQRIHTDAGILLQLTATATVQGTRVMVLTTTNDYLREVRHACGAAGINLLEDTLQQCHDLKPADSWAELIVAENEVHLAPIKLSKEVDALLHRKPVEFLLCTR